MPCDRRLQCQCNRLRAIVYCDGQFCPDITQTAPEPSYSVWQASRQVQWDGGEAPHRRCCRPLAHAIPPGTDHRSSAPHACGGSAGKRPTIAMMAFATCRHAAFETGREIRFTNRAQNGGDVFLSGIHRCHLEIRRSLPLIYVAQTTEPDFPRKCGH